MYYIYSITRIKNGRKYIGKARHPRVRFNAHARDTGNSLLANCFMKYGRDRMQLDVLACTLTEADAFEAERQLIKQHSTKKPHGLNLTDGGEGASGAIVSSATRTKMSAIHSGRPKTPARRARIAAAKRSVERPLEVVSRMKATQRRNNQTPERRAAILAMGKKNGEQRRGKPLPPETRAKIGAARQGLEFSTEWRTNISEGQRRLNQTPERRAFMRELGRQNGDRFRGKKQSPEQVAKRVASRQATLAARRYIDVLIADQLRTL